MMNVWDKIDKLCDRHLDEKILERTLEHILGEQKKTNQLLEKIVATIPAQGQSSRGKLVLGAPVSQ